MFTVKLKSSGQVLPAPHTGCSMDRARSALRSAHVLQTAWRFGVLVLLQTLNSQVYVDVIRDVSTVLGSSVVLSCRLRTTELMSQLTWQRKRTPNNENLLTYRLEEQPTYLTPFAKERITFVGGGDIGDIRIRDVTLSDEGTYLCSFTTHPSGTREEEINLHVQVTPEIYVESSKVAAMEGDSPKVLCQCLVVGAKPQPNVTWDTGHFYHTTDASITHYENQTVTIVSDLIMKPQRDLFHFNVTCVVAQGNVKLEKPFSISNIHFAPYNVYLREVPDNDGAKQLSCEHTANPPPTYRWIWVKGSETLNIPSRSHALSVPKNASNGYYVCEAENSVGRMSGSFYVTADPSPPHWYIALIFLIPSLLLNAFFLYRCYVAKRRSRTISEVYS